MARVQLSYPPHDSQPVVEVALSERNLIVLLSKLYTPDSASTILVGDVSDEFAYAVIRCERDERHYASPTRQGAAPGPMHPIAELVHGAIQSLLAGLDRP
jgi:hypothetical protein